MTGEGAGVDATVTDPQERAREGLEHLQAAARELIHAARAMLDVAEAMVDDPETVAQLVGALGTVGDVVRQVAAAGGRPAGRPPPGANGADGPGEPEGDRPGSRRRPETRSSSGLQRITVA
jgi:hypothetical protein